MQQRLLRRKTVIDAPIRSSAEDDLGRAPIAHAFARSILELDASQGLVVGVLGPWGHGKSSFINLMREEFEGIPKEFESSEESEPTSEGSETRRALTVIDFNPWMFSGSDQLIDFFFTQIGAELRIKNKRRFRKIAKLFQKYGGILRPAFQLIPFPGAGAVGDLIVGAAGTTSTDRSVQKVKDDITEALSKLEKPIVVVIDDIDRLTKIEIREIFKLVRLTASFPNIIYLLAFDRERVEQALSEGGISGRAYLEKIVLLSFDVPQASEKLLRSRAIAELGRVLSPITNAILDEHRWISAYSEVIEPLLSNIRDVTRYAISAKQTIKDLGDKVDLVDLLALDALRVFRPEIFLRLPALRNELTGVHSSMGTAGKRTREGIEELFKDSGDEGNPSAIESLLNEFPGNETVVALLAYVFPASQQDDMSEQLDTWRTERRMAHIDFLNLYFDRVMPDSLVAFRHSEYAVNILNDRRLLENYLTKLPPETLEDAIDGLASYETKFTDDMVIPGSITLLNLIDIISKKKRRSLFDTAGGFAVRHVVIALLHRIDKEEEREKFVSQILEGLETYSSKLYLIDTIRYRTDENRLVSEAFVEQIHADFVKKIQDTPPSEPSREWDAWRIYYEVGKKTHKVPLNPGEDPILLLAVLYSLRFTLLQSLNPFQDQSKDRLDWDKLVKLFGSEDKVRIALGNIRDELGDDEVLRLADRYLQGWEPDPS